MTWVLDASVILKWLLEDPDREPDTDKALTLIQGLIDVATPVLQPTHWLAEVAAVLVRLSPDTAVEDMELLAALQWPATGDAEVLRRATQIAVKTGTHVFDTLYHAVALEHPEAVLITADERYLAKAKHLGRIQSLSEWAPGYLLTGK